MEFTSPGLLGPAEQFRAGFAVPIERNGDDDAAEQLKRVTGPFILRRLKTDRTIIADLPDKLEMKVWCNLTAEQASLYQATVADMMARIEAAEPGIERRGLVLATMAKLKQVCNHPAHLLGDGSRLRRPVGQAGPAGGDLRRDRRRRATRRCASPSTPSSAACSSRTWPPGSAARCTSCTAARRRSRGTRWSASSRRRPSPRCSCSRSKPAAPA